MSLHWYGRRERGRLRGCGDSGLFAEEIVEPEAAVAGWAAESIHAVVGRGEAVVSVLEGFCVRERVRHAGIVEGLAHAFVPIGHGGLGDGARTAMGATQTAGVAEDPARPVDVLVVRTEHGRRGRARSRRRRASDGWRAGAWAWAARPGSTVVAGTGCGPRMDAGLRTLRCSTPDARRSTARAARATPTLAPCAAALQLSVSVAGLGGQQQPSSSAQAHQPAIDGT